MCEHIQFCYQPTHPLIQRLFGLKLFEKTPKRIGCVVLRVGITESLTSIWGGDNSEDFKLKRLIEVPRLSSISRSVCFPDAGLQVSPCFGETN